MKKTRMDKFLELSFKIGKVLSSVMLVVVLLVVIGSIFILCSFNIKRVETPSFSNVSSIIEQIMSEESKTEHAKIQTQQPTKKIDELAKYNKKIELIIQENHLAPEIEKDIKNNLSKIEPRYRNQYLNGFSDFCKEGLQYLNMSQRAMEIFLYKTIYDEFEYYSKINSEYEKAKNSITKGGVYNIYICKGLLKFYDGFFHDNISSVEEKAIEQNVARITAAAVLGISLLIFVILLFLPVLIKIEENTRQTKEIETKEV